MWRTLEGQQVEALVKCTALNRLTGLGMPTSVQVLRTQTPAPEVSAECGNNEPKSHRVGKIPAGRPCERRSADFSDTTGLKPLQSHLTGGVHAAIDEEEMILGLEFGLHEPKSKEQEARVGQQQLYFSVKDLRLRRSQVAAWGGNSGEIKKTERMDLFVVRDPDGNESAFTFTDPKWHSVDPGHPP